MKEMKSGRANGKNSGKIAGQGMKQDTAVTLLLKNNENFAELFNHVLSAGKLLAAEELQDEDIKETAYLRITKERGGTPLVQYRDVVKSVKNGRIFAVFGVENQSEIDYAMPFRILEVDFVNYARQVQVIRDRHNAEWEIQKGSRHIPQGVSTGEYLGRFLKTDRIVRCVTLVLYWGKKPWDGPVRLSDLFEDDEGNAHTVQLEMNFLDVCRMTEEEICSYTGELRSVFGFRKYADDKDALRSFIDANREYFRSVSETAVDALTELTHSPELKKIKIREYTTPEGGIDMCRGIQGMIQDGRMEGIKEGIEEGIKEGIKEGMEKGIKEGKEEAKKEIACSLSAMGMSAEKIAKATKAGIGLVRKWISESGD